MIMGEMLQDLRENSSKPLERVYWREDGWQKNEEEGMGRSRRGEAWGVSGSRQQEEG